MIGRPLELISDSQTIDGETLPIFISRGDLLKSSFGELLEKDLNFRLPLEVTFYGEEAEELGGPRKEFLSALLKEISREEHRLCIKEDGGLFSLTNIEQMRDKHWYFAAGLTCGLSVIQNGPLPTFLKDFDSMLENPTQSQQQFLKGLNKVGLTDLIRVKPCMKFFFRPGAMTDVSVRRLRQLLHPKFNEPGSNKKTRQEKIYALFLRYIKEVAAGRREVHNGKIFMGHILVFITSSSQEPVLGYTLPPKICFVEDTYGSLSSTCTNTLYLPIPGVLETIPGAAKLFDIYDLAFCNTYYGKK